MPIIISSYHFNKQWKTTSILTITLSKPFHLRRCQGIKPIQVCEFCDSATASVQQITFGATSDNNVSFDHVSLLQTSNIDIQTLPCFKKASYLFQGPNHLATYLFQGPIILGMQPLVSGSIQYTSWKNLNKGIWGKDSLTFLPPFGMGPRRRLLCFA